MHLLDAIEPILHRFPRLWKTGLVAGLEFCGLRMVLEFLGFRGVFWGVLSGLKNAF